MKKSNDFLLQMAFLSETNKNNFKVDNLIKNTCPQIEKSNKNHNYYINTVLKKNQKRTQLNYEFVEKLNGKNIKNPIQVKKQY